MCTVCGCGEGESKIEGEEHHRFQARLTGTAGQDEAWIHLVKATLGDDE